MNAMKTINVTPMLPVSTGWGVTSAPVWEVLWETDDCVRTLMNVQHLTSALLPPPASTLVGHITVTVAAATSSMTPGALIWMSVRQAAAALMRPAQIHQAPSHVSVQQDTVEMGPPARMWMNAHWPRRATQMPYVSTFLAPTTVPVRWVILEMG